MAFGKKSKKQSKPQGFDDLDDLDYLTSDEENFSADDYPIDQEEDISDDELFDDKNYIDFDDDDNSDNKKENNRNGNNPFIFVGILISVIAIISVLIFFPKESNEDSSNNSDDKVNSQVERHGDGIVVNEKVGETYTGNDNGSVTNGIGAILAFDYAYYTDRDGAKARSHFNPTIKNYDATYVQSHIDKVPNGTEYQLQITPKKIGEEYDVVLTLSIPGEAQQSWDQKFTVMEQDGQYYVKSFTTLGKTRNSSNSS